MNRVRMVNLVLIGALTSLLIANWAFRQDRTQRNLDFLPDMARSKAYESYSAHPDLPSGKALQPPVPGTVLRGQLPLHYSATPDDAVRAGEELSSPLDPKTGVADTTRGGEVWGHFCQPCHGGGARGDGPVAKRGYPPPPSLLTNRSRDMADGQLFHIITYGQGNMAPYAAHISRKDRWKLILHIRSLQGQDAQK